MSNDFVAALRSRRPDIRRRWRELLRADRPNTPLANPEALVNLIDWTLEEIERALLSSRTGPRTARPVVRSTRQQPCDGEPNPFLPYFAAAEQALHEALVLAQAEAATLSAAERDAALHELNFALDLVAEQEINAFRAVCQHRETASRTEAAATDDAGVAAGASPATSAAVAQSAEVAAR